MRIMYVPYKLCDNYVPDVKSELSGPSVGLAVEMLTCGNGADSGVRMAVELDATP